MLLPLRKQSITGATLDAVNAAVSNPETIIDPSESPADTVAEVALRMRGAVGGRIDVTMDINFEAIARRASLKDCRFFGDLAGLQAVVVRTLGEQRPEDGEAAGQTESYLLYMRRKLIDIAEKRDPKSRLH